MKLSLKSAFIVGLVFLNTILVSASEEKPALVTVDEEFLSPETHGCTDQEPREAKLEDPSRRNSFRTQELQKMLEELESLGDLGEIRPGDPGYHSLLSQHDALLKEYCDVFLNGEIPKDRLVQSADEMLDVVVQIKR